MIAIERTRVLRFERVYWIGGAADEPVYPPPCPEALALVEARREYGLTIGEVGRVLGLSPAQVCDLERGRARPVHGWTEVLDRIDDQVAAWRLL